MAECDYCGLEMNSADGCLEVPIVIEGASYEPIPFGSEWASKPTRTRCGDCNIAPGKVHHHGCDAERCPCCGGQSISCGCVWAGEEHLANGWVEQMESQFQL
jgi:hypothetical protein